MLHFEIYPEVAIDFVYESAVDDLNNTRMDAEAVMMQAVQEADVLLSAILELDMVTEASVRGVAKGAGTVAAAPVKLVSAPAKVVGAAAVTSGKAVNGVKKVGAKAKDLVNRIIQFIKNLFARIVDTMQTWFQNSGKWLESRKDAFKKFKYDDLSIEMVPYWDGTKSNPIQRTSRTVLQYIADAFKQNGVDKKEFDYDTFVQKRLNYLLDKSGDLTEGMKNFYRVGVAQGKDRINLRGADLSTKVNNDFIPTILNYNSTIQEAQTIQRTLDNRTSALAIEFDKRGIALESALFDLPYHETPFATFEQFDVLLENENDQKNNAGSSANDRTQVKVGRDTRSNQQKQNDTEDSNDGFVNSMGNQNNGELRILNNILRTEKLMMSCYLTVMQERYSAYMNALKAIWSTANNEGGRNKDVNGKDKVVGKDEKKQ